MTQFRASTPAQIGQYLKSYGKKVKATFWLGAGASVSAGIPDAESMATQILDQLTYLPRDGWSENSEISRYAHLMANLSPVTRRMILKGFLDKVSGINQTHAFLSKMIQDGWVNLVLSANFDNLLPRGLRLLGVDNPWIVDVHREGETVSDALYNGAIVYLNGTADNHRTFSTSEEGLRARGSIRQAIFRAVQDSVVIVLGYSGRRDPLLEILAEVPHFAHGLFWVTTDAEPAQHVRDNILGAERYTEFFGSYDADRFMRELVIEGMELPDPGTADITAKPDFPTDPVPPPPPPETAKEPTATEAVPEVDKRPDQDAEIDKGREKDISPPTVEIESPEEAPPDVEEVSVDLEEAVDDLDIEGIDLDTDVFDKELEALEKEFAAELTEDEEVEIEPPPGEDKSSASDEPPPAVFVAIESEDEAARAVEVEIESEDETVHPEEEKDETPEEAARAEEKEVESLEAPAKAPSPAPDEDSVDVDMMISHAREASVIGGSDELMRLARQALETKAERAYPSLAEALMDWGDDLFSNGEFDRAGETYQEVLKLNPEEADAYTRLSAIASKQGNEDLASEMSRKADELKKKDDAPG